MGKIMKARGMNANFVQIPNSILRCKTMSLKAKGLLCYLLSLPEDWVVYKTKLHNELKEGRDATIEAFNELIEHGYVVQVQIVGDGGRFEYDYVVYNEPVKSEIGKSVNGETVHGKSVTENPYTESPLPYKERNNKEIEQTKKYTLTRSKDGELFEASLKEKKEDTPQVAPAPPDFYPLPKNISHLQERFEKWLESRAKSHSNMGLFEQENQIMLFVGFCNRNNLNQYDFFEHCITCASAGGWKNLNPELANKSFKTNNSTNKLSGVNVNVKNLLKYANRPENQ